jgi:hypothetical protein
MNSHLANRLPEFYSTGVTGASDADIKEFRASMMRVNDQHRTPLTRLMQFVGRRLSIPLAISNGLQGIRRYGRGVKKRNNVGLIKQFRYLTSDHLHYRMPPESFYMYRHYLPENRCLTANHFDFSHILPMQQHLIDCAKCEDFLLLRNKHLFARRCSEINLPSLPLLAEFEDGKMISHPRGSELALPEMDLFSKPSQYWCGIGANLWTHAMPGRYRNALSGEAFDRNGLIKKLCADSKSGRIVLQEKASNHSSMIGSITMGGLATIRFVTCRTPSGSIDCLPPVIRIPIAGAIVDNIAQGGLAAPLDIATGKICGPAIQKNEEYGISIFEKHPDTGVEFAGIRLPFWREVLDLAMQAHLAFPSMHFVGWDIAILQDGPVVVEGNSWWDVDLILLPNRISLSDTQFIPYYNHHLRSTGVQFLNRTEAMNNR